jgi:hypothetical protein
MKNLGITAGIILGILLIGAIIFRVGFVTFIDNYEFGYKYDAYRGTLQSLPQQGYVVTPPWVSVHTIDMRPIQVCINANSRVLNCKLVEFDTCGWRTLVAWHGRGDYDANYRDGRSSLNDILLSYAYDGSGKTYPFLKIKRELKPDDYIEKKDTNIVITKLDTTNVKKNIK